MTVNRFPGKAGSYLKLITIATASFMDPKGAIRLTSGLKSSE